MTDYGHDEAMAAVLPMPEPWRSELRAYIATLEADLTAARGALETERDAARAVVAARSVGEAVAAWLKAGGYDGLAGDECGCKMFLCDLADANCKPAYYVECGACERKDTGTCIYPEEDATGCFIAAARQHADEEVEG